VRRAAAVALAALAVLGAAAPVGAAAEAKPVEWVGVFLHSPKNAYRHVLLLKVSPLKGIATVRTLPDDLDLQSGGVTYAVAFPPHPFDGSIDVKMPGLGEFVGSIAPAKGSSSKCGKIGLAQFNGRIRFRGAGNYGTWGATRAAATMDRSCTAIAEESVTSRDLFAAAAELGPTLPGPSLIRFEAVSRDGSFVFAMSGDSRLGASFVGIEREWRSEVAVERWVRRQQLPFARTVTLGPGGKHPAYIAFRPPKPFFGVGRYSRRTHRLTGSLGANLLGLRTRLASHPLVAVLEDEEPRVE
jgi:hypothetical protein